MLDLTQPEIKTLLWAVHIVEAAYGDGAPEGITLGSAKTKLLAELAHPEHNGQRGITLS